jgi:hypothetical protein
MDASYVSINSYQNAAYQNTEYQNIVYQYTYERLGQIITILSGGTNDSWGFDVAINEEGNIIAGSSSASYQTGIIRIYKYNDISWVQISQNITSGSSISLNSAGNIVAIGDRSLNAFAGEVSVYRYVIDNSWVKINQSMTFTTVRFADDAISLNSSGTILAIGSPFDNPTGSYSGRTSVYKYITDGSWVPLGQTISGESEYSYGGYSVSLNSSGYILAIGASYNNNAGGFFSGQVRVYRYTNDVSWVLISQDIDGTSSYDQVGFSVSLNGDGTLVACGAMAEPRTGYAKVYKYISDGSWIPQGQTIYGEATNDQFGFTVSLNKQGNILGIGGPYNDGSANSAGHVRIYKYNDVSWIQIDRDIDGDTANDNLGYSIALNGLGNRFVVGAPYSSSGRGYVKVYNYQSIVSSTSTIIPTSFNSFTEKLDISYLLNSVFEASHNNIKTRFDISFATINVTNLEASSIIIETINTPLVNGINKPLEFIPHTANTRINTTISGDLALTGKAYLKSAYLKSFNISNKHNFDISINGYSSHYLTSTDVSASIVDYYSNVGSIYNKVFKIDACGNVTNYTNEYGTISDSRLKENIVTSSPKLEDLLKVRVVNYNLKGSDKTKYIGVLAQELEELFPELVTEDSTNERFKSVNYSSLTILLIKAFQEQQVLINNLI